MAPYYNIYNHHNHQNNIDSIHNHSSDNKTMNSSEIKKGTMVMIQHQNASLISLLPSSSLHSTPSISSSIYRHVHNHSKLVESRMPSATGAKASCVKLLATKRLPVIVSVYRKDSKYLALVTLAGRQQQLKHPSPLCVNLHKYKVYYRLGSNTIDLKSVGVEGGLSLTLEATSSIEASEWAKVLDVQNFVSDKNISNRSLHSRLNNRHGGLKLKNNNFLSNSLEEIEEEENSESFSQSSLDEIDDVFLETTDNGHLQSRLNPVTDVQNKCSSTCLTLSKVDNIRRNSFDKIIKVCDNSNSTGMPFLSPSSSPSMSSYALLSSSLPSSSPYWNSDQSSVSCVSRRPSLPALSESEEEDEEENES